MRIWIPAVAVATVLSASALVFTREHDKPAPSAKDDPAVADLRNEVARLQRRVGNNEATTNFLANTSSGTRQASFQQPPAQPASSAATESAKPPSIQQEMARFQQHFAKLDELRGKTEDVELEKKLNNLLRDTPASLEILKKANVGRVECGNQLCRLEVTFPELATARMGQSQLQAQTMGFGSNFTAYMEPEGRTLYAYYAVGTMQFPEFPQTDEASDSAH